MGSEVRPVAGPDTISDNTTAFPHLTVRAAHEINIMRATYISSIIIIIRNKLARGTTKLNIRYTAGARRAHPVTARTASSSSASSIAAAYDNAEHDDAHDDDDDDASIIAVVMMTLLSAAQRDCAAAGQCCRRQAASAARRARHAASAERDDRLAATSWLRRCPRAPRVASLAVGGGPAFGHPDKVCERLDVGGVDAARARRDGER